MVVNEHLYYPAYECDLFSLSLIHFKWSWYIPKAKGFQKFESFVFIDATINQPLSRQPRENTAKNVLKNIYSSRVDENSFNFSYLPDKKKEGCSKERDIRIGEARFPVRVQTRVSTIGCVCKRVADPRLRQGLYEAVASSPRGSGRASRVTCQHKLLAILHLQWKPSCVVARLVRN